MKKKNLFLYLPLIIIMFYSLLNMYNVRYLDFFYKNYLLKQLIWFIVGFALIFIFKKIRFKKILNLSFLLYIIGNVLLLLVLIFGKEINGSKAWFSFYFFSFQPSEIMRIFLTLFLCNFTDNYDFKKNSNLTYFFKMIIFTLIPSVLVFLEPDTGAIIYFIIILISILFLSKIKKKYLYFLSILIILFLTIVLYLYFNKQDILIKLIGTSFFYRFDRLINFYNSSGYQIENALTTISSSSFFGVGLGKILLYIPEGQTDFIFAFTIGNFGLLSGIIILLSYFIIDLYLLKKLKNAKTNIYKLFLASFICVFFFNEFYNILMNLNLLPIMGIPLPFLSYGGSSIITYFIFLGIIVNNN